MRTSQNAVLSTINLGPLSAIFCDYLARKGVFSVRNSLAMIIIAYQCQARSGLDVLWVWYCISIIWRVLKCCLWGLGFICTTNTIQWIYPCQCPLKVGQDHLFVCFIWHIPVVPASNHTVVKKKELAGICMGDFCMPLSRAVTKLGPQQTRL